MGIAEILPNTIEPTWLDEKHNKAEIPCPLGCGGSAKLLWSGNELKAATHGDCSSEKIKSAISSAGVHPTASAPSLNGHTNGHAKNGNGVVALPEVNLESWKLRLHHLVRADLDDATKTNAELVRGMSRETLVNNAIAVMRLGIASQPEYRSPKLTSTEIEEELYSVAERTIAAEFGLVPAANGAVAPYANGNGHSTAVSKYAVGAGAPALSGLRVYNADEFFAATDYLDQIEWCWQDIFPSMGLIGVFGDPEAGKSTFCRTFALAASRGDPCLGRTTKETNVLYLDLADEQLSHRRAFKNLGWTRGNLQLVSQDSLIGQARALDLVEEAVKKLQAKVVIVDMMADLLTFRDLNDYANAKEALRGLRMLSRETNALFIVLHHTPKALGPDADVLKAGLGSQAIVGSFDLRIAVRRRAKDLSTIVMSNGKVGGKPITVEHSLTRHQTTEWIDLGSPWESARKDYYADRIFEHFKLQGPDEKMTALQIAEVLDLNPGFIRASLRTLIRDNRLAREGEGKPHKPFYYRLPDWTPTKDNRIVDE